MIIRNLTSNVLRATLAGGASAIAICLLPPASAQVPPSQVYILRSSSEVADGDQVLSTSSDILMGRYRKGDRSLLVYDVQNGAIVVERGGETAAAPLISRRGPELSFAYDYGTGQLQGDKGTASVFNTWLRPIAMTAPALGADATWAVTTDLRALGVMAAGPAPMGFKLRRTYLQVDSQAVVLLEYETPAFHYRAPGGESIVHWARGFAVVDTEFSQIFVTGTQHRASATSADGEMRPVSVRSTMHGIEPDGSWTLSLKEAPAVRAASARVAEVSGGQAHPVALAGDDVVADPFPAMLASYLDMAAFAIAEGAANPVPVTGGVGSSPEVLLEQLGVSAGNSSSTILEALGFDPQGQVDPALIQALRDYIANPGTGLPPGFEYTDNVQSYQPTPSGQTLPSSGSTVFILGDGPAPEGVTSGHTVFTFPNGGSDAGQQGTGSTVFVFPNGGSNPDLQDLTDGATVFYFSDGGGNQQASSSGVNHDSGGGTPISIGQVNVAPGSTEAVATFRAQAGDVLRSGGMSDQDADRLLNALLQPDRSRPLGDRSEELDQYFSPMLKMAPGWEDSQRPDNELTPSERTLRQLLGIYSNQHDSLRIEERLRGQMEIELAELERKGKSPDNPAYQAAAKELADFNEQILNARYERMIQRFRITDTPPAGSDLGNELVPGWMSDPDNPYATEDEAMYLLLREQMRSELEEARKIIERLREEEERQREKTVYDDTDDFYLNNAYDYTSMVGIIPTDLSRWQEWLATQNIRGLERLALTAGYPNLASALADAQNILRQSQDPGYRQWALQAPSCNGPAGCGPSYLERWHMKTSIVALGDILNDSRDVFSTGGFSDIGISSLNLSYLLRDNALEDGDIVRVRITQFGRVIYEGQISLTNLGQIFNLGLGRGVASLEIFAVNEGTARPNTAQITVDDVVRGQATQSYSLATGETATLRIEAGAKPGPTTGTSGAPQ